MVTWVGVSKWGHPFRVIGLWTGGGLYGYEFASISVLKDFTDDALTISDGSLFKNGTARQRV